MADEFGRLCEAAGLIRHSEYRYCMAADPTYWIWQKPVGWGDKAMVVPGRNVLGEDRKSFEAPLAEALRKMLHSYAVHESRSLVWELARELEKN